MEKMTEKKVPSNLEKLEEYLEELEQLSNDSIESLYEGPSWDTETCCLQALSNIFITPKEVIITADLPYIDNKTIEVVATGEKTLEIKAKMKKKVQFSDLGILHRKGEFSFLRCQSEIAVAFDSDNMKISCKEGILEVRLPRKKPHEFETY